MKKMIFRFLPTIDFLLLPFVYASAWLLRKVRRLGVHKMPKCKNALIEIGVFPIINHYYEPQFDYRGLVKPLSQDRILPAIDWNVSEQIELLSRFSFSHELSDTPLESTGALGFYLKNDAFKSGDAEYLYQLIRLVKPKNIYEVGSGNSTLMAIKAINKNHDDDPGYRCRHICIEPYEKPWLEKTGVSVIRKKIEEIELTFFSELKENDILFIDSSHVIRPQGDVLFEYLELLPTLNQGVIVHIHDIFSPKNYLKQWLVNQVKLWNEQYLLEAFLSYNKSWKIIGALNYLHHHHYEKLKAVAPFLSPGREPGSFYIQKNG